MKRKAFRNAVFARDKGVCACCGVDTVALLKAYTKRHDAEESVATSMLLWDWGCGTRLGHLWAADHIIPLAAGGRDEMENLQTLCTRCHKKKTVKTDTPTIKRVRRKRKKAAQHRAAMKAKGNRHE